MNRGSQSHWIVIDIRPVQGKLQLVQMRDATQRSVELIGTNGDVYDLNGFGTIDPNRWITSENMDAYMQEMERQHIAAHPVQKDLRAVQTG